MRVKPKEFFPLYPITSLPILTLPLGGNVDEFDTGINCSSAFKSFVSLGLLEFGSYIVPVLNIFAKSLMIDDISFATVFFTLSLPSATNFVVT